jgi:hypothetical protein
LSTQGIFFAIEITGWSSRQPRNDAEVFINIGVGGRILSDFIAGDYLDDLLASVRLAADHSVPREQAPVLQERKRRQPALVS